MSSEYGGHTDFMKGVRDVADRRQAEIESALREAFSSFVAVEEYEVVMFSSMSVLDLAHAIVDSPLVLKPLLVAANIGGRAIERDLGIANVDTYRPRLTEARASAIAGYIKPFLPPTLAIRTLSSLDRAEFIDKEIRKRKGHWEDKVRAILTQVSHRPYRKTKFEVEGQVFELDAAVKDEQGTIVAGVDVKRVEARRDIHKRADEIINKATKLKSVCPRARFGAVVYYPFIEEHVNVRERLRSPAVDCVVFASEDESSIRNAVKLMLDKFGDVR